MLIPMRTPRGACQAEAIRKTGGLYNRLAPFVKKLVARWLAWTC